MYQILCGGTIMDDIRDETLHVIDPVVNLGVNSAGTASLKIPPNHPHADLPQPLKQIWTIKGGNEVIFRGRQINSSIDFQKTREIQLEGIAACLNDSYVPPFDYPNDPTFNGSSSAENVVEYFLGRILYLHNAQSLYLTQEIKLGTVTVTDHNNYIHFSCTSYENTWDTLRNRLWEGSLGGYMVVRYSDDGAAYIDYLADLPMASGVAQEINVGENLLELSQSDSAEECFSAVVPVGKDGLTIAGLSDGTINSDLSKSGVEIVSATACDAYSAKISRIIKFDNVTTADVLMQRGIDALSKGMLLPTTIEAKAFDLHLVNDDVNAFKIGTKVRVVANSHGVSGLYDLKNMELHLHNPESTVITLGMEKRTLAGVKYKEVVKISKAVDELTEKVQSIENSTVENAEAIEIVTPDTGSAGIWRYRKWDDGTAECWGEQERTDISMPADGNSSSTIGGVAYPSGLFVSAPICTCNIESSYALYKYNKGLGTASACPKWGVHRIGSAVSSGAIIKAKYHAIGRWK